MDSHTNIKINIARIFDEHMTWEEAKAKFNLTEGNIQKIYIRYIIKEYSYITAAILLS